MILRETVKQEIETLNEKQLSRIAEYILSPRRKPHIKLRQYHFGKVQRQ